MKNKLPDDGGRLRRWWFFYTLVTMAAWGLWGALIDSTAKAGFPEAMGYVVWAFTMLPPALIALRRASWRLTYDVRSIAFGAAAGLLGAGGQLVLFKLLRLAPAYLVFPIIALSPLVTVILAFAFARERAALKDWIGIVLSLLAGVLLAYSPPSGRVADQSWLLLALIVFLAWGVQGFVISRANRTMSAESIFFYMAFFGVVLVPVALMMVDFGQPINWGFRGFYAAVLIQSLNSIGAFLLVYALRYGKAIIVAPLVNAGAPVITILVSLLLYRTLPNGMNLAGIAAAIIATLLLTWEKEPEKAPAEAAKVL